MIIKTFTSQEIYDFLYQDDYDCLKNNMESCKRRLKYFDINLNNWREDFYVCMLIDNKIIGVLNYCVCPIPTFQGHRHFISYVSVDGEFHNKGIAGKLVTQWYENLHRTDIGVCGASGFTQNGFGN